MQTDIIQRAATELDHYLGSGFQECMDKTKEIILNIELIKNHRIKDVKEISEKELRIEKHVCRYSMAILSVLSELYAAKAYD